MDRLWIKKSIDRLWIKRLIDLSWIKRSIGRSLIKRSINRLIDMPINLFINQLIDILINLSINLSIHLLINLSINFLIHRSGPLKLWPSSLFPSSSKICLTNMMNLFIFWIFNYMFWFFMIKWFKCIRQTRRVWVGLYTLHIGNTI